MASPIGHALIGIGVASVVVRVMGIPNSSALWVGSVLASCAPDLDCIAVGVTSSWRFHRSVTHSLLVLSGGILMAAYVRGLSPDGQDRGVALAWSAALLSHPLLDVATTSPAAAAKGFGIPLFWPLLSRRWSLNPPLFQTAELAECQSVVEVGKVLSTEMLFLAPASLGLVLLARLLR